MAAVLLALCCALPLAGAFAAETAVIEIPPAEQASSSPLADAAMERDMPRVRELLGSGVQLDVNAFGRHGTPALHWVLRYGDAETAALLVRAGADLNLPNRYGVRPLQMAIENGHVDLVRWLLENGADANGHDQSDEPLLFKAAELGDLASLDLLLAHGAVVDAADAVYGQTALMVAVRNGQAGAVQRLLAAGADVNRQTQESAVMPDRDGVFVDPSEIPGGLSHGRGIIRGGWPERGKRQPLAGAKTPLLYATRLGDPDITRLLVEAGADLERPDANGVTPLLNAVINGNIVSAIAGLGRHLETASYLVSAGANVNATDWYGQAPLFAAIDVRNMFFSSNAVVAATENHVDRERAYTLIEQLLDAGADPNVRTREYPPARFFILAIGSAEWVNMIGQTPFIRAAQSGDVSVMHLLLDHGADPNLATENGTTALMAAAGINWVMDQTYDEGAEALLEAVKLAHTLGNAINATNAMGLQAIHGAANRGSNAIIEYLAANGAELDRPDEVGRTPTNWAEGEYLPSRPLVPKPDTIALLQRLQE
ncbi:MAG TPA: ankyrin repeat domain-containing protein [Hyphomicrobiales bacterium]|nr:ankyrin repeat domain-containing protein [Hyphomicrobiales bacterium]